ncbi:hypothetical protein JJB09_10085 [Rhizobium sp. KVB221]|uniref:Uncharacterized protein n=1 Tax=Rhizobium setariae TaxID=2801340 RepID=A0A936YMS6_9HYPH|nr:hypothetical protein [Rhizobium setariae]MBL0372378.1 hypothetical protein [Rhizobium setariae]
MQIAVINENQAPTHIELLVDLLTEAVTTGALVGHVHPLNRERSAA